MFSSSFLSSVLVFLAISGALATTSPYTAVCQSLLGEISTASDVYYPGSSSYYNATYHWAISSSQSSACVVEPGNAADVASILGVLGSTKTPFAVKGGGHATNPGFSSTPGVHISMNRFSNVTYDAKAQTATLGSGLIWDDVYAVLEPFGVSVLGGRVIGVGVAGLTLGGGYSWKTNQYGLTIDTVQAFELVLPTGEIIQVTESSYPDLFFGLRGGGNNFGIVTKFTLKTFKQTEVWGGSVYYEPGQFDKINEAVNAFAANSTDPKAVILPTYYAVAGIPGASTILFYDGPCPPAGTFDAFLSIPYTSADVKTRSYSSLIASGEPNANSNARGFFQAVSVKEYTPAFLDAVVNETKFWGTSLVNSSGSFVSYSIEPFLATHLSHSTSPSAFPPQSARDPSIVTYPLNIYYAWNATVADDKLHDAISASSEQLKSIIVQDSGAEYSTAPLYSNYAIYDTPLELLYGVNVPILKALAQKYDPQGVMKLAGGFKFQ